MASVPKIIILSEQLRGQAFELIAERYTVGRSEDCDICIPDPTISSNHCALVRETDGSYRLVDNGSTNGSRVNGVRVQGQQMVNSDIIQIGGVEMLYDCEEKSVTSVLSTQTGINLDETGEVGMSEMSNFSPFSSTTLRVRDNKKTLHWMVGAIAVLLVMVVVVLIMVILRLLQ